MDRINNVNLACRLKPVFLVLMGLFMVFPVWAELSVFYPKVPSPYDQIFNEIINGIEQGYAGEVNLKALTKKDAREGLGKWLEQHPSKHVIALGKRGFRAAKDANFEVPLVIGALPVIPTQYSGISLLAAPEVTLASLKELAPNIKNVHVVHSKHSDWLVNLAQESANQQGFTLLTHRGEDVKRALGTYETILQEIDPETDAIWLPLDPITANEQVILPRLLERSWEKNIVLFSSKPSHAKRGALFSMFPDHFELGQALVALVERRSASSLSPEVFPLKKIKLAVNLRTAEHLGFKYKSAQRKRFYLTFPQ